VTILKYTKYIKKLQRVAKSEHAIETEISEDNPPRRGFINKGKTAREGRRHKQEF
jgi:hypothetical protein